MAGINGITGPIQRNTQRFWNLLIIGRIDIIKVVEFECFLLEVFMAEDWIIYNQAILTGKPIIKGTRISVAFVLQCIASGMTIEQILSGYPSLNRAGILAALDFAARQMSGEEIRVLEHA